ncbi:unnamed protein product, partial [Rotaria magnacalcarata]
KILLKLCDELRPNLILTTGGTGSSPDDITPEVCDELSYYKENSCETSVIQALQSAFELADIVISSGGNLVSTLILYWLLGIPTLLSFNQSIDHLDPRPEYIRFIIEWSTQSSISIVRIISPDIQCSLRLISARRCKDLDGYNQQVY